MAKINPASMPDFLHLFQPSIPDGKDQTGVLPDFSQKLLLT
jgi:hypothetical protein